MITTPIADALLSGGLSLVGMSIVLVLAVGLGVPMASSGENSIALSILINSPHFLASYRILYFSRAEIAAHPWATIVVPALLFSTWLGAAWLPQRDWVYGELVFLSSIYLAWHYTGQAWGMVAAYARLASLELTRREVSQIRFGMRCLLVLHVLYALAGRLPPVQWIEPGKYVELYRWAFYGTCTLAAISLAVGSWAFASVRRRLGRLPVSAVVPWAALYLWYPFWYFVPGGFLFVQQAHALQYLAFPLRVEVNRYAEAAPRTLGEKRRHALFAYVGLVLAGALILNGPPLAAHAFGEGWYSTPDARAVFLAFTNCVAIHHYFVDGAIWKLSNPRVRRQLFGHVA